jgi:hypothetical protein
MKLVELSGSIKGASERKSYKLQTTGKNKNMRYVGIN